MADEKTGVINEEQAKQALMLYKKQGVQITHTLLFAKPVKEMTAPEAFAAFVTLKIIAEDCLGGRQDQLKDRLKDLVRDQGEQKTPKTKALTLLGAQAELQTRAGKSVLNEPALLALLAEKKIPSARIRNLALSITSELMDQVKALDTMATMLTGWSGNPPKGQKEHAKYREELSAVSDKLRALQSTIETSAKGPVDGEKVKALVALSLISQAEYDKVHTKSPDTEALTVEKPDELLRLLTGGKDDDD